MEQVLQWDTALLLAINGWHSAFGNVFMWNISSRWTWIPLYIMLVAALIRRYGKRSIWMLLAFGACVGLADFISSGIIKEWVMRPRPSREPALEGMVHIVNGMRAGKYGFVSSHAANTISISLLFCLLWRDWRATLSLTLFTVLNCYSRMYMGVHYPLDILGGLVVGTIVALLLYAILRKTHVAQKKLPSVKAAWHWGIVGVFLLTLVFCCFSWNLPS